MATGKEASRVEIERLLNGVKVLSTRYGRSEMYSDEEINALSRAVGWMAEELLDVLENGMDVLRIQVNGVQATPATGLWKKIEQKFHQYRNERHPAPEFEPEKRPW